MSEQYCETICTYWTIHEEHGEHYCGNVIAALDWRNVLTPALCSKYPLQPLLEDFQVSVGLG